MSGNARTLRWGWHQLGDEWACRLVEAAGIRPGDLVLDIGAGRGALTAPLLDAGARVVAIELHPARVAALRRRFAPLGVVVVRADASDLRLPRQPFRVVANPPFASASAVLRRLTAPGSRLVQANIVLPGPVAHRWAAARPRGAGRWATTYRLDVSARLPRQAFRPPAPCSVSLLRITRRGQAPRGSPAG